MFRKCVLLGLILTFATHAEADNMLVFRYGTLFALGPYDVWGFEHPDWTRIPGDSLKYQTWLEPLVERGLNTTAFTLAGPNGHPAFFNPAGDVASPALARQFTRTVSLARAHFTSTIVNLFPSAPNAWLESPHAYEAAARNATKLLPEKHSAIFVIGDFSADKPWPADAPYPLDKPEHVLALARTIHAVRDDCMLAVPARAVPGADARDFLYVTDSAQALAKWLDALHNRNNPHDRKNPHDVADHVSVVPDGHILLQRDIKTTFDKALHTFADSVEAKRLRAPMPPVKRNGNSPRATLSAEEKAEGFKLLFDGQSLDGWTTLRDDWGGWVVSHGAIELHPVHGPWLMTDQRYANFILRLEFKISPGGNSGIFIRAPLDARCSRFGIEFQIRGKQYDPPTDDSTGAIYDVSAPKVEAAKPAGQWNNIEIACRGPNIRVHLNGQLIQDLNMDAEPKLKPRLRRGVIGLQDHSDPCAFRNIRIKLLDHDKPAE